MATCSRWGMESRRIWLSPGMPREAAVSSSLKVLAGAPSGASGVVVMAERPRPEDLLGLSTCD
jgi:hypothetical protein